MYATILDFFFIQIEKFVRGHPIIVDVHFGFKTTNSGHSLMGNYKFD
jgi:hypothetical protein